MSKLPTDVIDVMGDAPIAIGNVLKSLRTGNPATAIDLAILETVAFRLRAVLAAHTDPASESP